MIKIELLEIAGLKPAIHGMRNAYNSWDKSDSECCVYTGTNCTYCTYNHVCDNTIVDMETNYILGPNDHELSTKLSKAGSDHRKFMRMIAVYVDITAPLYWWKEFDTYKVGTVANSCSTMHTIADKEFALDDFSHEHLVDYDLLAKYPCGIDSDFVGDVSPKEVLYELIDSLNKCRRLYLETKEKKYWWQMIQLLPTSYNQKRTVMLNYEVLGNMYHARKNHKLDEWRGFCEWIEKLPYRELITLKEDEK